MKNKKVQMISIYDIKEMLGGEAKQNPQDST